MSPSLKRGIILDVFSCDGTTPEDRDIFISLVTCGKINGKSPLISLLDRMSIPLLALGLIFLQKYRQSLVEISLNLKEDGLGQPK